MEHPAPGRYRRYDGALCELICVARHSASGEELAVYRVYEGEDAKGVAQACPLSWWQGRTQLDGRRVKRFVPLEEAGGMEDEPPACPPIDAPSLEDAREILARVFGFSDFRPGQAEVISACLAGRDVLGVMPTGAGKSLCYQIPALALGGVTLVVSPLISLMKDQVGALRQLGVSAAFINSSLSEQQIARALDNAAQGLYKLIYIAPERLLTPRFERLCAQTEISLVAIDEAHCISQWGQDFRPSYLDIPRFLAALPRRLRVSAFTATATDKVREDIVDLLGLKDPYRLVTGFDRPNLYYSVLRVSDKRGALMQLMRTYSGMSGIIYCATRKTVEEVHQALLSQGINAGKYHAGMDEEERRRSQDAFSMDETPVMVATNAFGMGIDKSNVRYVIHYNLPKDPESYYQEAGRAGRDGERADCVLLYSPQDLVTQRFFIEHLGEEAGLDLRARETLKKAARQRLDAMKRYASCARCLRASLLEYFGESAPERCGHCAVCDGLTRQVDASEAAKLVLQLVKEMRVHYGAGTLIDILRGSKNEGILSRGLNKTPLYGSLRSLSRASVDEMIEHMVEEGALIRSQGEYPVLDAGPRAEKLERDEMRILISQQQEKTRRQKSRDSEKASGEGSLLSALKRTRMLLARQRGVPPYMIFSDATLSHMAKTRPHTAQEFLAVHGVGEVKCRAYAPMFIDCIKDWEAGAK
ncbi:MAG: DNA helicase RecQ [Clostridia bacterium]|nr:DNA helicase RecQ [Clostridia bacterium]